MTMTKQLPLLALVLSACTGNDTSRGGNGGDDEPSEFSIAAEAMTGIYRIDGHTLNEAACSPDGVAIQRTLGHAFAVAFQDTFFGIELLTIMSCGSPQECRDHVAARTGFPIDFAFSVQWLEADGSLAGGGGSSGYNDGGTCVDGEVWSTSLTSTGTALRIEQGITVSDNYPADDGVCWTDLAADAADGNDCSKMEVLTATFVEAL